MQARRLVAVAAVGLVGCAHGSGTGSTADARPHAVTDSGRDDSGATVHADASSLAEAPPAPDAGCVPAATCASLGYACGTYTDSCGVVEDCGACPVAALTDSTVATDWLVKDVCVDGSGRAVAADPYYECPGGTSRRKIQVGDPLPYHNVDQPTTQQDDVFPILEADGTTPLYLGTFDFAPFDTYNKYDGSDGFDTYVIRDGWVSGPETEDGGGFGQTFYGSSCTFGDGWIYFPTTGFLSGGTATLPIQGVAWEQSGEAFPGKCPTSYFADGPTQWQLVKGQAFGGIDGNIVKDMDAMITYHGYVPSTSSAYSSWLAHGGMEVFYFTQQYGKTRWESWVPASQIDPATGAPYTPTTSCVVPPKVSYGGLDFVVRDCRDWSQVTMTAPPAIPQWPVPEANILPHFHFDAGGGYVSTADGSFDLWHRGGNSAEGNIINWSLLDSTAAPDTRLSSTGVRYLATNCAGTCTGPSVQEIYEDLPIASITSGATYLYGVDARSESGSGMLQVTLQEIDAGGAVVWQDFVQGTVAPYNGTAPQPGETSSIYLSTAFVHKLTSIPVAAGAMRFRFYLTPLTSQTFDILDVWLDPFPAP